MTNTAEFWNSAYDNDIAPWVIGQPQPAIIELERAGRIRGRVLDPGSGAGEHTILLTKLGYDVLGVDLSPSAVEFARTNATERGVPAARFQVADMLRVGEDPSSLLGPDGAPLTVDTVVDSALFHCFGTDAEARAAYVRSLHMVCEPGGQVHILALSNVGPGLGPRISDSVIRDSFGEGWELEDLQPNHYRGRLTDAVTPEERAQLEVSEQGTVEASAWLARIRRL